jgi:hypothetical protein
MVQRTVGLFIVAAALALPAGALGGQYKVLTCQWPGANGVNNSWTGEITAFGTPQPSAYQLTTDCRPGGAGLQAASAGNTTANYLTIADFRFSAPAGTRVMRLEVTRHGEKYKYSEDPARADGWAVYGQEASGVVLGGGFDPENCHTSPSPGPASCTVPPAGAPETKTFELNTTGVSYGVVCGDTSGCPTNYGIPLALMTVRGAAVTLEDDSNPTLTAGGPLLGDGWVPASATSTVDAGDNSGISSLKLLLDGTARASAPTPCNFTKPVPCANVKGATLGLGAGDIADGPHTLSVVAADAAGNPARTDKRVQLDGHAPSVSVGLPRRGRFSAAVTDGASGVARVVITGRDSKGGDARALKLSRLGHGRITGFYNRRIPASRLLLHVVATDKVGNTATQDGHPMRLRVASRVRARFGRAVTIRGRLIDAAGRGAAGRALTSTTTLRRTGAGAEAGPSTTTGRGGRFSLRLPGGLSRDLRLTFAGGDNALGTRATAIVAVPAATTFKSAPGTVRGRGRVTFRGTVARRGQAIPPGGLSVLLQGRQGKGWRTFKAARTDRSGRWRATYRFSGRPGRFAIRATVRRSPAFPFDTGSSRVLAVRVR